MSAYWGGWYDSLVEYGEPLWDLIDATEGDWLAQDVAMLAALYGTAI